MTRPDVAVVGGGLAGTAAALAAADAGATVMLLEKRPHLGGAAAAVFRRGRWQDHGQHVLLRCCTAYRTFIERIGGGEHLYLQQRLEIPVVRPGVETQWIRRNSWPAPLHLGPSIARYAHLSLRERALVGPAALALRGLDRADASLDRSSFGSWLTAHGQSRAAVDALWDLIALPTLNLHAPDVSLLAATRTFQMGLLHDAGAADIGWSTVPLSRLHDDLARKALASAGVEVRLRCGVDTVERDAAGTMRLRVDDGADIEAKSVILAVPHHRLGTLLPPEGLELGERVASLGASPIVNIHLTFDRPAFPYPLAACLDTLVQWVFDRSAAVGLPAGRYLVVSQSAAEDCARMPARTLIPRVLRDLKRLFPDARAAQLLEGSVIRDTGATPRLAPGSDALRAGSASPIPGIFVAGAWTDTGWPATMESAVRSGSAAAAEAARDR